MKRIYLILVFMCFSAICFAQKQLLSYDDLKYLLQNNIIRADTFMVAKGYTIYKPNKGLKKRDYRYTEKDGRITEIKIIIDGRRVSLNIETCEMLQFDVIKASIGQYGYSVNVIGDIQVYHVKDLGDIYVSIIDTIPYSPIKKDYNITLRGETELTVLN